MPYTKKVLDKSQVEFTLTVPKSEYEKHLGPAAERLSKRASIKGFRKGNVPYEVLRREIGDMAIIEEALETIIREAFYTAVMAEKLDTIGMPQVKVEKLAPDNDIVFVATVALLPNVKLPSFAGIKVEKRAAEASDKQVEETLDAVRGMHAIEIPKDGPAGSTDKLVVDMDMMLDNVPVEGGQSKNYQVYLSEPHYIPGFNEQVVGLKKGDTKDFELDFPKEHYQKHLAGKKVSIKVKVNDVLERQLPELSDELAQKLGQESVAKLRELIAGNIRAEAEQKAEQQLEIELLDQLVAKTTFDPIPDVLIDAERQKMFYELKRDLDRNGITVEQYLADIKKKEEDLLNDFRTQAEKRAKAALISREVAKENNIMVSSEEIDAEIKMMKEMYKHNKEYTDNIDKPEVRDTIATHLQNRKVMMFIKAKVLGTEMVKSGKIEHGHGHQH